MDDLRLVQLLRKDISKVRKLQILDDLDVTYVISSESSVFQRRAEFLGYNCLHIAAITYDLELIEKLIKRGANVLQQGIQDDKTPLRKTIDHFNEYSKTSVLQQMGYLENDDLAITLLSAQIKSGNPYNAKCKNGISHLHIACMYNHAEAVWFLAKANESVDQAISVDSDIFPGYTPLHCAIRYSSSEAAGFLLTAGANIYLENAKGISSVCYLIERMLDVNSYMKKLGGSSSYCNNQEMERLSSILQAIVLKNRKDDSELVNNTGVSAFHLACALKDTWIMQSYTGYGVKDINKPVTESKLWQGWTPLHFAVCCNIQTFGLLLKKGADISVKNAKGETAFDLCLQRYSMKLPVSHLSIDTLLSNKRTNLSNLMVVMSKYDSQHRFWDKLIDISVPLEHPIWSGYNLLHFSVLMLHRARLSRACHQEIDYCSRSGQLVSVPHKFQDVTDAWNRFESIWRKRCSVYSKDANGLTPIHLAFQLDEWHALEELLQCAHRDVVGQGGLTLLHIACAFGKIDVVEYLLKNGAYVNSRVTTSFVRYAKPQYWSLMNYQNTNRRVLIRANSTPLHIAVLFKEDAVIQKLLENHADVQAQDEFGYTPLHLTLISSRYSVLRRVSSNLRDVRTKDGLSYLHVAAFADDEEAVRKLLRDGADVNGFIRNTVPECFAALGGKTPLHLAVGREKAARVLIENGANMLMENPYSRYETPVDLAFKQLTGGVIFEKLKRKIKLGPLTASGLTTLHVACSILDLDWARRLLKRGANPNAQMNVDVKGQVNTPMHLVIARATSTKSIPQNFRLFVELLIEYDADVNINNKYETPLHLIASACFEKSLYVPHEDESRRAILLSMADWLLSNQRSYAFNSTDPDGFSHFHIACILNNCAVIKKYLDSGVDINHSTSLFYKNHGGFTPVRLDYGVVINRTIGVFANNHENFTPLHFAIMYKNVEVALLLLERGADVRVRDADENTLLHFAIKHCVNSRLFHALLGKGIDINAKNIDGNTPILCLLSQGKVGEDQKIDAIQILLNHGASVSVQDSDGNTPLHLVVQHLMNFQLFDTLWRKGVNINARNVKNQTPILCLLSRGDVTYEQFRFFVNRGSRINIRDTIDKQGIIGYAMEHTNPSDVESVMEALMELINLNHAINKGFLAIHNLVSVQGYLTREHYINVIQRLTAKGSDIDESDEKGKRALALALSFYNKGAVDALLWLGADVNCVEDEEVNYSLDYYCRPYCCLEESSLPIHYLKNHLWKMAFLELDMNTSFQRTLEIRIWQPNEGDWQVYASELRKIEDMEICKSLKAEHFLSEWEAVIAYPNMPITKRQKVNNFFKKDDDLRKELPEFAGLLMLQYRKALARVKMMQPVKDILAAAGIDLPDLCLEAILKYFKNSELNFLIDHPDEMSPPIKRRRFQ